MLPSQKLCNLSLLPVACQDEVHVCTIGEAGIIALHGCHQHDCSDCPKCDYPDYSHPAHDRSYCASKLASQEMSRHLALADMFSTDTIRLLAVCKPIEQYLYVGKGGAHLRCCSKLGSAFKAAVDPHSQHHLLSTPRLQHPLHQASQIL